MKLDICQLERRCEQSIEEILSEVIDSSNAIVTEHPGYLAHIDRGADVLMVAHMDWVDVPYRFNRDAAKTRIRCPRLDDRLGVYTILDFLPSIGIEADVLLTDDEEIGKSTAKYFVPPREYKWVVEFDRRGEDVVTYDLDSADWLDAIRGAGFNVARGSFSDICYLDSLDCCMMNVAVGYHQEHQPTCYLEISEWKRQMVRFRRFWTRYQNVGFDQDVKPVVEYVPYKSKTNSKPTDWMWANKPTIGYDSYKRWTNDRCLVCDDYLLVNEYELCAACLATRNYGGR